MLPSIPVVGDNLGDFVDRSIVLWSSYDQISKARLAAAAHVHAPPSARSPLPRQQGTGNIPGTTEAETRAQFKNMPPGTRVSTSASGALSGTRFSDGPTPDVAGHVFAGGMASYAEQRSAATPAAQAAGSRWYLGQRYPIVRSKLIAHGYRPLHLKHRSDLFCYDDDFCRRFPEAFSCSAGGIYFCEFAFVRLADKKYVVVTTRGETQYRIDSLKEASETDIHLIGEHRK